MTEPYVELHCHSCYSLLDGTSFPEALVAQAAELGMPALALTDHDAVYGAVRFAQAAHKVGIKPIFGAEITLESGHHLTLLVKDERGWRNLCRLLTIARHNAPKGEAKLPETTLALHTEGLIALSGCRHGVIRGALSQGRWNSALQTAHQYRDWFGQNGFCIELQHHLLPADDRLNADLIRLAKAIGVNYVATNNVHYVSRSQHELQDVLVCIRHNTSLDEGTHLLRPNSEYFLKSGVELAPLFADYPDALANTLDIAEQCAFDLNFGLQTLPAFPTPEGKTPHNYLEQLCRRGFYERRIEPSSAVLNQLAHELDVIERSGLSNYFLIVWDVVRFALGNGILCQGRGSAANSLVAYLLGISPVNPLEHQLVFERFLSDERQVVPDIDIDFQADRREEVIQYVYGKYGIDHAAMACTFITFRDRSALRDVGKALGLPPETLARISHNVEINQVELKETVGKSAQKQNWKHLQDLCQQIDGLPRHLGIHNGGMIIMRSSVADRLPTEPATMQDRYVVQWDKDGLEEAGLVKIDILGLRMLSAIAEARRWIGQDLSALPFNDPEVYKMISRADTVGVFQVESRAQAQVLPRMKPRQFNDLIVSISLIRPGPVQGDMVHPYLRRRLGVEPVQYPHPLLQPALEETLGIVLYQEQVLKVARDLAGFSAGQGEQLRRALGSNQADNEIERFHSAFLEGAVAKGVEDTIAGAVFDTLRAFGSYSFPKSHAAAFAVLVYQSAWLKRYHPQAFYTALLNHQPMGFWSPAVLVNDARRHGIEVLPVDVNLSHEKCTVDGSRICLGFNYVKGLGKDTARILLEREQGSFPNLRDFCQRTQLPRHLIENLILAGAMDSWGVTRRKLLWELGKLHYLDRELDLAIPEDTVNFPSVSSLEVLGIEYELMGLSLRSHIMSLYREWLSEQGILDSIELERCSDRQQVTTAGLILVHQAPPTAKGHHFITLEDEHGFINILLRPDIYTRYRSLLREYPLLIVEGTLQKRSGVINLIAVHLAALR